MKASTHQRIEALKGWLKDRKLPDPPGSYLIDSTNYKFKRHEKKVQGV